MAYDDEEPRDAWDYPIDPATGRERFDTYDDRLAWGHDFYAQMTEAARQDAEHDYASRWVEAWDLLERFGVVGPEDQSMTLAELERVASYIRAAS